MVKQFYLFVIICFLSLSISAQILSPAVLSPAGTYGTGGGYTFSYTVGEMAAINTDSSVSNYFTQGFEQPYNIVNGLLDLEKDGLGSLSLYPVPAVNNLWYGYEFEESGHVNISVLDITGRDLGFNLNEDYANGKVIHELDCGALAAGNYLLSAKYIAKSGQSQVITRKFEIKK